MSELVENVRGIIETHIAACEPPDAIARAAIAAVIEFLYLEAGRSVCPGAAHEYLSAAFLEKQIKVAGGPRPEAMEGTPPATDPAPAVCEWTDSGGMLWATECGQSYGAFVSRFGKDAYCPHCDKIIKFSWRPRNDRHH